MRTGPRNVMSSGSKRKLAVRVYGKQKRHQSSWSPFLEDEDIQDAPSPAMFFPSKPNLKPEPHVPKTRATSQKAATMAAEPDPAMVDMVVEVTGCTRGLAVRFLKVKQQNIEAAVHGIFENEDITSLEAKLEKDSSWDDNLFSVGRDGNDGDLRPLGTSPAPTRGTSPVPSLGMSQPQSRTQEDQDLEAALALSRQDLDMPYQQETGVRQRDGTETGQKFGPATREHYESSQWALVPTSTVAHEIVPDVDADQRRNMPNEPRFLKHLPDGDYTPNFISICQAIPAAREAFILRDDMRPDYGQAEDWWRGHAIPMPRIVHTIDGSAADPNSNKQEELIAETQRLMAFLDNSARSYATIGALTQTEAIKSSEASASRSGTLLELFIDNWKTAAHARSQHADDVAHLFTTTIGTNSPHSIRSPELNLVDLNVRTGEDEKVDLSELLDDLLWNMDPDDLDAADHYIERPAEIIVMRLSHHSSASSQLGVQVPAAIHLDKYLKENNAATRSIRQQMAQGRRAVQKLDEIERKIKFWPHPSANRQIEARQLLQHTIDHFSGQNRRNADAADTTNNVSLVEAQPPHYANITQKLEDAVKRIDHKLNVLDQEKDRIRKAIADISKSTLPGMASDQPQHRYTLRGVATKPNITYILRPKYESDEEEMLLSGDEDGTPPDMQWWRIDYEVSGATAKITKTKAADYDVLRAVELEHNSALLVYASDSAGSPDLYEPLPEPLQDFCRRDDAVFLTELRAEHSKPPAYEYRDDVPRQSIERTSMDSTRVEDGGSPAPSPPGYDEAGFHAHPQFGLGYDVKHVERADVADPPTAEIKLSPEEDLLGASGARDIEMVQKAHKPLVPSSSDAAMGGTESQDAGIGGSTMHMDDVDME